MTQMSDLRRKAASAASRIRFLAHWHIYRRLHVRYAEHYRSRLHGVTFVGVTGSAGKTSATAMIGAILASAGSVQHSGSGNRLHHIARAITRTLPSDRFCVLELGAERPGYFDPMLKLMRPSIGVVTTVGDDHQKAFGSREAIAAEKGKLVAALPPDGVAVLNADDPLVWAMRERCRAPVVSFGVGRGADLQASDIRSDWPERLSFAVRHGGTEHRVQTQLCGRHWVTSTLAALATGVAAGVPLGDAVKAVAGVAPPKARMEPVTTPDEITFIRDDWKGALWGMPTIFAFLKEARAERKIMVLGTLADYHGSAGNKYREVGREGLQVADIVMFVGKMATHGLGAQKFATHGKMLMAFPDIRQASDVLQEMLRAGDLVVLKGSGPGDHLGRLYHARTGPVACWRSDCGKMTLCDGCDLLRPRQGETAERSVSRNVEDVRQVASAVDAEAVVDVLVGIGNAGEKYRNTPHNVGFAALDILAERYGLTWESRAGAQIARLTQPEGDILLVKPQKNVNNTGRVVLSLSSELGFNGDRCILAHDDIHLPIGKVRTRLRGSDGGHLGVRSVLTAFQSSDIARVKIGVGAASNEIPATQYLVSSFPSAVVEEMKVACNVAADRLLTVVGQRRQKALRPPVGVTAGWKEASRRN